MIKKTHLNNPLEYIPPKNSQVVIHMGIYNGKEGKKTLNCPAHKPCDMNSPFYTKTEIPIEKE